MSETGYRTISRDELQDRFSSEQPDNQDPKQGYALVNVLDEDIFEQQHIPGSINIPQGNEQEFEKRFDKEKELIVYCASTDCDASPQVAQRLTDRGFSNVRDFEAGMREWKEGGLPVEGSAA